MATFGKTGVGATELDQGNQAVYACKFTAPAENGAITKLSVRLKWGTVPSNIRGLIYSDNVGVPNALLVTGTTISRDDDGEQWWDLPISYNFLAGVVYWLAVQTGGGSWAYYDAGSGNQFARDIFDWGAPHNPFTVSSYNDYDYSIYATYTPSAGVSKKRMLMRMLMGVGLAAKTPKFTPRKVVPWKCPLPLIIN